MNGQASTTNPVLLPDAASDWNQHEHVAPAVELEAQKLIDHAGSPDLAKQAIDAATQHHVSAPTTPDEFAQQWGFASRVELFASSTSLTQPDGSAWWVTTVRDDSWLVWNEDNLTTPQQFSSRDAVNRHLAQTTAPMPSST